MRFMMIVKSNQEQDKRTIADKKLSEKLIGEMRKYNEQLAKAGVLLDLSGLHGTSRGTRIKFSPGGKKALVDGPFTESKELVAGFWIIDVNSREEAIEWANRAPAPHGPDQESEIEVRQFIELEDYLPSEAIEKYEEVARIRLERLSQMKKEAR
ncbi:MAG TPA: YciI family protein [Candidatus Acidoferrum sp.]